MLLTKQSVVESHCNRHAFAGRNPLNHSLRLNAIARICTERLGIVANMHLDDFELILTRLAALADSLEEEFSTGDQF